MNMYNNLVLVINPGDYKFIYNGKVYYRYMDQIYIPAPPCKLLKEDVISLSEIRMQLNHSVINYEYTKLLINELIKCIPPENMSKMIDFGCGGGILSDVILDFNINTINEVIGLDMCSMAVNKSPLAYEKNNLVNYQSYLFNDCTNLNIGSETIDSVISSFVMHFTIYENQLVEIYRVLKSGGYFVYNDYIYQKYPDHTKKIIQSIEKIGFSIEEKIISLIEPKSNSLKKHKIVIARKL